MDRLRERVNNRAQETVFEAESYIPSLYPVTCHTDHVGPGSTFIAIKGFQKDGVVYIPRALERGATTIVVDQDAFIRPDLIERIESVGACLIRVEDTRQALAQMSARAAGYPAEKLKIIAITGTKGKTTNAYMLAHCLRSLGHKTALLSTVCNMIDEVRLPTQLTTQQPDYLHLFFKKCVAEHIQYVVMEVAAQAQTMHRTHGIMFDALLFTNFGQEHAEFYKTQEEYFEAKCSLFNQLKEQAPAVVNADGEWFEKIRTIYPSIISYSCAQNDATYVGTIQTARNIQCGIQASICVKSIDMPVICPELIGTFNVYNVIGVISLLIELGNDPHLILQAIEQFHGVPGRLEHYELPNGAQCFIDYAHNPSSFEAVLSTLSVMTDHLIVVFGAGGDRDQFKRPIMGSIAMQYAQCIILTTDNPRSEDPYTIITDIMTGIDDDLCMVVQELDRRAAIERAYKESRPQSIIAILGKGPDEYQVVNGIKTFFSDKQVVLSLSS